MSCSIRLRNTLNGFTNDFKVADNGILNHRVPLKRFFSGLYIPLDLFRTFQNMREVDPRSAVIAAWLPSEFVAEATV